MPKIENHSKSSRGRPRNIETQKAILTAAYDILKEHGYSAASFEAIAKRARVSRPTLYRRWNSRKDLMLELLKEHVTRIQIVQTGNVEYDMSVLIKQIFDDVNMSLAPILRGLAIEAIQDDSFARAMHETFEQWRNDQFYATLNQNNKASQHIDDTTAWDIVIGAMWQRLIFGHKALTNKLACDLAALIAKQIPCKPV